MKITGIPEHLKVNAWGEMVRMDISPQGSYPDPVLVHKKPFNNYPIILKEAYSDSINKSIKNIIIPYNSKHIKWKDYIFYPDKEFKKGYDEFKIKCKNNILRYYDYNDQFEKYSINCFYSNYKNTYSLFEKLPYKGYTNGKPNTWISINTSLFMDIKQNNLEKAVNKYLDFFNGHNNYIACKYIEYLSKKNFIDVHNTIPKRKLTHNINTILREDIKYFNEIKIESIYHRPKKNNKMKLINSLTFLKAFL